MKRLTAARGSSVCEAATSADHHTQDLIVKLCQGFTVYYHSTIPPTNSFKQHFIFGTYKINFIIHSLHVYIVIEFLDTGICEITPKLMLIIRQNGTFVKFRCQKKKNNVKSI